MTTRVFIPVRLQSNIATGPAYRNLDYVDTAYNRHMTLHSLSVGSVQLAYSPKETTHSNLAATWEEIPRSGQLPILVPGKLTFERMTFEAVLAAVQPDNITGQLQALKKMANSKDPITIAYTSWEGSGSWRITSMEVDITMRSSLDHSPTMARVSLEFVSLGGDSPNVGMLTGGTAGGGGVSTPRPAQRTYTVRAGDTLWSIAVKVFGDGERWTELAKLNNLTWPRKQLPAGKVLKLRST
jgi:nucleoid-associated protein YgaU